MADGHDSGTASARNDSADSTARAELSRLVLELETPVRELREGIHTLRVAKVNDEASYILNFIERGMSAAMDAIETVYNEALAVHVSEISARNMERRASIVERQRAVYDRTVAATQRLKAAFEGLAPDREIFAQNADRADEALEDAFYVLALSLRHVHAEPLVKAMARAGYRVEAVSGSSAP